MLIPQGNVAYLVAPDVEHHLQLSDYARRYPKAKIVGVEGLAEKHPELKFAKIYGKETHNVGYESEIDTQYFAGFGNKDLALLHKKSKTLIQADLLFNLPGYEQYAPKSSDAGIMGKMSPFKYMRPDHKVHKAFLYYLLSKDKPTMIRDAKTVMTWDFDRIIPCHGEVIETGGKRAWASAYEWLLNAKEKSR